MRFIDIEIAEKVNHVTGIEYEKSLADICLYVSKRLNIKNHTVENEEFSIWYSNNEGNKYDVIFSFAIHHWLNLSSNEYVCILDNLLNKNGYIWFESHNGLQIDEQYYEIVDIFKEKGYSILKDEAIADDGGVEPMLERRFVLIRKI